ncbi:hypothetical protein KCH_10270 [Kitasatospora cheerisanensis KCTC 2395]|uniref:Uncharacterized protein n=1 Tax=Kitasatospora cheerisanensis KCTC 2395 TaxID=1348663 RepID=A0A066ZA91_9ACTN|nr:hypothetical protein KCH_10270 [Kitasatospora cheerisanensis KCTC 2395]
MHAHGFSFDGPSARSCAEPPSAALTCASVRTEHGSAGRPAAAAGPDGGPVRVRVTEPGVLAAVLGAALPSVEVEEVHAVAASPVSRRTASGSARRPSQCSIVASPRRARHGSLAAPR